MKNNSCFDERSNFTDSYERSRLPAVRAMEKKVLGCDYGGTSWTTRSQVDHIISSLALDTDSRLLEIGAGSGWPGLYIGRQTACCVTLMDIPVNALKQARTRARDDQQQRRVRVFAGSAENLPLVDHSFDRLSHSDVLCCLPEKVKMLSECRRVATTGARMHFSVILPAENLASAERQRVSEFGPPFIDIPDRYEQMLTRTCWKIIDHLDISMEFRDTLLKLSNEMKNNETELIAAYGKSKLQSMRRRRAIQIETIQCQSMKREVFVVEAV